MRHLLVAEAFFGRTDAINFVFTCKCASVHPWQHTQVRATHAFRSWLRHWCDARRRDTFANSPGATQCRAASLQIALVRRSASRASLRHACNESSLDWRGEEHRPKRVYTRAHGHTDKRGQESSGPLSVTQRAWKTVCVHRASELGPLVSGRCCMRPIRAQIERSHGSNPSARSEPSTNGSTAQKGYSCNM